MSNPRSYHQVVYITDTQDGPGHASTSIIKSTENGSKVNHTSFYPHPYFIFPNAVSLGSVPVPGKLVDNHEKDLDDANHVLVKEINKDEYKQGKTAQRKFSEKVENGEHLYSVFRGYNPLAKMATFFYNAHNNSQATHTGHVDSEGFFPPEDHTGLSVYSTHHHLYAKKSTIHNCVSSTTKILNATNVPIGDPLIPTNFTSSLQNEHGFRKIDKDEFRENFRV